MKLVPIADRVILKAIEEEETTASGIVLPGQSGKEKPSQGEIIAVGPGGKVNGDDVEMVVKKGQKVVYSQYAGNNVKLGDDEYTIIRQSDIMAIIE